MTPAPKARRTAAARMLADATSLPAQFLRRWEALGGPDVWEREYRFHPNRKWRFDLACPGWGVAVEIHGGVYADGRHVRGKGFTDDRRKMNEAVAMGWRVFELTTEMLDEREQMELILGAVSGCWGAVLLEFPGERTEGGQAK